MWADQVRHLSPHYRVITPDLRGHGKSPAPGGIYAMDELAADVLALLDRLQVERAAVAGHSMGGYVALALWRLAPERIAGMGLVATQARADTEEGKQPRMMLAEALQREGAAAAVRMIGPRLLAPDMPLDSALARALLATQRHTPVAGLWGSMLGIAERPDCRDLLPAIRVPALVLVGLADQAILPERSAEMAAALPDAMLVELPGVGHMPNMEQPEAANEAVSAWLGKVWAGA